MTLEVGVSRLVPPDVHHAGRPSDIGMWSEGADLRVGWWVQVGDGRWCEVVGAPVLTLLGRVSVEVSWQGGPSEQFLVGFRRIVWCRTWEQECAYVDALETQLEGNAS